MRRITLTGSGLWRASRCIASAVLPRATSSSKWTERGTAIHEFLLNVNRLGRDAALEAIADETLRAACALIRTELLPVDPGKYAPEVALAYDVVTGRARELHRKGDRDYSMCTSTEIPATLDVVALVGDRAVLVADYKSGWKYLEPPELNWQFRFGGLVAARAFSTPDSIRDHAYVTLIRIGADGEPYATKGELDMFELAEVAEETRELHADAMRAAAADVDPPITIGSHCDGCDSISFCGSTALIRRDPQQPATTAEQLTPEMALDAHEWLEGQEAALKAARKVLDTYAKWNPFRLRDGRIYGPVEKSRERLEGTKVWQYLNERYGAETAWKVAELTVTKAALGELCRELAENDPARKLKKTTLNRAILDDLREIGAVKTSYWETVEAHKAPKEGR